MASVADTLGEERELPASGVEVVNGVKEGGDEDDLPVLSSQALAALKEFLGEQDRELEAAEDVEEVALVAEDWRLSQFWYDRRTAETVAAEVATLCKALPSPRVACIACPTLYAYLKKMEPELPAQILEYDKRFEQYGNEFTFYDYNHPVDLPSSLKHLFPVIVADPPYLSKECLEKVTETIKFLSAPGESYHLLLTVSSKFVKFDDLVRAQFVGEMLIVDTSGNNWVRSVAIDIPGGLLSSEVQKDLAGDLLGLRPCGFRPHHSSKLGNEFCLFTSYDPGSRLHGWDKDL